MIRFPGLSRYLDCSLQIAIGYSQWNKGVICQGVILNLYLVSDQDSWKFWVSFCLSSSPFLFFFLSFLPGSCNSSSQKKKAKGLLHFCSYSEDQWGLVQPCPCRQGYFVPICVLKGFWQGSKIRLCSFEPRIEAEGFSSFIQSRWSLFITQRPVNKVQKTRTP